MIREFATPPTLAAAASAWLGDDPPPSAVPRAAATVLLVRDDDDGVEVFMLRRQTSMAFAAGMYVFPGGGVDPRDAEPSLPWTGPSLADWGRWLGAEAAQAGAMVCAAVRETFEECGVLLAGPDQVSVTDDVSGADWETDRQALITKDLALTGMLDRRGLVLRSDLLRPWAHWITPEFEPRRYDTRFFLAAVPTGQRARHVGGEAAASGWWRPGEVLRGAARGDVGLMPPTLVCVEELAAAGSVEALLSAPRTLSPVMPAATRDGDRVTLRADL
ncbi:MAG TPA: NUDIX hydrolase [Actinomycetales bacterium]|nr:NUDIX hydrolase [Actinomycetales bacterium]